jgi:glycine/D-amino acid oxidase-like deaminating enzyme
MKRHAIIIGAGIVGASLAYHLSLRGFRVTVIDAAGPAAGASGASDGAVSVATKTSALLMDLALASKSYYAELAEPGGPLAAAYHRRPAFIVAESEAEVEFVEQQSVRLEASGVVCRALTGKDIGAELSGLRDGIPLVVAVDDEGHALGYEVVERFLAASGATVVRNKPVDRLQFTADRQRVTGVQSGSEVVDADAVVVAAGLGSNKLISGIGLVPQRGQLIVTDRTQVARNLPGTLFFASYLAAKLGLRTAADDSAIPGGSLVIDPLSTQQLLIGSTREPNADPGHTSFLTVRYILREALRFMPGLSSVDVLRVFAGVRACTPDSLPAVGAVPGVDGLWVATGFGGDGICLAPLVGRDLAGLISGTAITSALGNCGLERFGGARAIA